tara:strand:+ start:1895 stop:2941 length:1047 start_codon:yes stop_codon:yes gene_type:complete
MKIKFNNKFVGSDYPVYFIAEIGVNHCGDTNLANKMIIEAKKSGADAVKFQTFTADSLVSPNTPKVKYQESTTSPEESHYDMLKALELSRDKHSILLETCKKNEIQFLSTPYDTESAKFLNSIGCDIFKTASADIVDLHLHSYLAKAGKTVIISTGMANFEEIEECVKIYKENNNKNFILLHCVSNYPCSDRSLNMKILPELRSKFNCLVGYSDHSIGNEAANMSVALGGVIIEKHFTTDKNLAGPDHKASVLPNEFASLVKSVGKIKEILGKAEKKCQPEETQMASVSRKSLTLSCSLEKGEKLEEKHLTLKRPGTGIFYKDFKKLIGLKAKKTLKRNYQIKFEDFE